MSIINKGLTNRTLILTKGFGSGNFLKQIKMVSVTLYQSILRSVLLWVS